MNPIFHITPAAARELNRASSTCAKTKPFLGTTKTVSTPPRKQNLPPYTLTLRIQHLAKFNASPSPRTVSLLVTKPAVFFLSLCNCSSCSSLVLAGEAVAFQVACQPRLQGQMKPSAETCSNLSSSRPINVSAPCWRFSRAADFLTFHLSLRGFLLFLRHLSDRDLFPPSP